MTSGVWRRMAASDGADALGGWGAGRPRNVRARGARPFAPVRQHASASSPACASAPNPGLAAPVGGNSVVPPLAGFRYAGDGQTPGLRSGATLLFQRRSAGGLHRTIGRPTAAPAGDRSAQSAPVVGVANHNGHHARTVEINGVPGIVEGAKISPRSTARVTVARSRGRDLIGAILVDAAKGIEPRTREAQERATSAMQHSAFLLREPVANVIAARHEALLRACLHLSPPAPEPVTRPANHKRQREGCGSSVPRHCDAVGEPPTRPEL